MPAYTDEEHQQMAEFLATGPRGTRRHIWQEFQREHPQRHNTSWEHHYMYHKDKIDEMVRQIWDATRETKSPTPQGEKGKKRIAESVELGVESPQAKRTKQLASGAHQPTSIRASTLHISQSSTSSVTRAARPLFTKQDILDVINFLAADDRSDDFLHGWRAFAKNYRAHSVEEWLHLYFEKRTFFEYIEREFKNEVA